ncbi:MAG: response regulator [Ilumatobacteraceae bacterium]
MNDRPVRVVLVEDHAMVLDAICQTLGQRDEIEVVGWARSHQEALELLTMRTADVLVTDLDLGDGHGTDLVAHATTANPPIPVLLITGTDDKKGIEAALASGCAGFVSKSQGFGQLVDAVLSVARGAAVFPAALLSQRLEDERTAGDSGLSPRELEVLQLLAEAKSVPEISATLHLSVHTVRNHIKQILAKLGAHSQLEAVVIAARRGQVQIS